jgi:hypothetical protein
MRRLLLILAAVLPASCDRADRTDAAAAADTDTATAAATSGAWPAPGAGPVDVRRQRQHDLTGDGRPENVAITASGPLYRDLDIRLVITGAAGDTLWADTWRSEFYFHYDDISQRTDDEVARSVREQVDDLLTDRRFHHRGMPPGMIGGDATDIMRESVRYHLAELDWRRRVDLEPADATPGYAHDRIDPGTVPLERVQAVMDELLQGPTYSWFAGGEASYVIGWSVREQAFVRLFACC